MLFYPIQRKLFEGTDREQWKTTGHIAGPLSLALKVVFDVVNFFHLSKPHSIEWEEWRHEHVISQYRLVGPEEGIGMAEDWLCPNCGYDHIIRWENDMYSCTACKTYKGKFYADSR